MAISAAARTQLRPQTVTGGRYGDFSGRAEAVPAPEAGLEVLGGGSWVDPPGWRDRKRKDKVAVQTGVVRKIGDYMPEPVVARAKPVIQPLSDMLGAPAVILDGIPPLGTDILVEIDTAQANLRQQEDEVLILMLALL